MTPPDKRAVVTVAHLGGAMARKAREKREWMKMLADGAELPPSAVARVVIPALVGALRRMHAR